IQLMYLLLPLLDIYIYFVQNYQNVLIKKLSGINTSKGSAPVLVDDTWRINALSQTYDSLVYIVPNGVNPEKELNNMYSDYPSPIHFLVAQAAIVPLTTALPSNMTSSMASSTSIMTPTNQIAIAPPTPPPSPNPSHKSTDDSNESKHGQKILDPGIIAAIVLACLAVLGACIAVFWVMRQSRRRKLVYGEKGHLELRSTASSSMFPMNHVDSSSREKLHYQNNSSVSITNGSTSQTNYPSFSSDAVVMSSPLLTAGNGPTKLLGTSHITTERGSLKSHTAPTTPIQPSHHQPSFGFISVPSLPLMEDHSVYMLGRSDNNRPQSTTSFSNISSRSEPPLTSTDALLIADTFRQRMRRPEWKQQQQQNKSTEEIELEEDQRRQLSEDLLKKELEAEGTLMKKVGKRAHLLAATYQKDQGPC
ncbi:hypothetical protein INT48_002855, partial [Thamnidium elegans]